MCVPLRDQSGKVRYYLGAQLDITSLVNDCTGLPSLNKIVERDNDHRSQVKKGDNPTEILPCDEFEQLSEAFNPQELDRLVSLRQRRQLQSEEGVIHTNLEKVQRRDDSPSRMPFADLDSSFQLNGHGSAPPLGYYKTVSSLCGQIVAHITDVRSIFWFGPIHHSVSCLLRPICGFLEFSSRRY